MIPNRLIPVYYLFVGLQYCNGFSVLKLFPHGAARSSSTRSHETRSPEVLYYSTDDGAETTTTTTTTTGRSVETPTLPFRSSIGGPDAELTFESFWEWHMSFLLANLPSLRSVECSARGSTLYGDDDDDDDDSTTTKARRSFDSFAFAENAAKKARVHNRCFESDEFRKIRMTYYDAGKRCQVFNALWYPRRGSDDAPVLGVDLLAFGSSKPDCEKRYLVIVDFQPVAKIEDDRPRYERDVMAPIRSKYSSLHGRMSDRFYDETRFFSKQMLFGRFEDDDAEAVSQLFPAYTEYVEAYASLIQNQQRCGTKEGTDSTTLSPLEEDAVARQTAYDNYSAERDPAMKMFQSMFGKDWADEFVHGFLFSLSSHDHAEV